MFRQWFLMGRMAVLAAATLLTAASVGSAQENGGYFKYLQSQGWYGNRSNSYYRQPDVSPRFENYTNPVVDQKARIHLEVPTSARVWFDNEKTTQTGSSRDFITPPLPTGTKYTYAIRVEWTENGHKVESTRRVSFQAGAHVDLDLTKSAVAQAALE
jgi:uncharacterized protein (TIGR03000 family)